MLKTLLPKTLAVVATTALISGLGLSLAHADDTVFISEIHYDNAGTDAGEAVEVQAPVGTYLTGWQIVLYNGNGNAAYNTKTLSGTVGESGVLVQTYPANGIQNGAPDGIALVRPDGTVAEFLSYEGEMTAADGPAIGVTSTDIGVSEAGSTPVGESLQRVDGTWTGPAAASFGSKNSGGGDPDEGGEIAELSIAEIQGTGDASTYVNQNVKTTGIVTAVYNEGGFDGFYLQTAGTGGDTDLSARAASDGIFVYSSAASTVAIGDFLAVTGEVSEHYGLTEITAEAANVEVLSDAADPVKAITEFVLPITDAEREVFEGMLVLPADRYVVSDTYSLGGWGRNAYGSIGLGLDGPLLQETDVAAPGSAEYDAAVADNAARAVSLDDGRSARTASDQEVPYLTGTPDLRTGAELSFTNPVILDYRFGWNFQPTYPVAGQADDVITVTGGNTQAVNAQPADVGGDLQVASFNVLNYFTTLGTSDESCISYNDRVGTPLTVSGGCLLRGAWDIANLERQQAKIVAAINGMGAEVVGLEEIENSAKFGVDRDQALAALVAALNADAGEDRWAYAASPATQPDLADQDVIRNAFIYQPAAVTPVGDSVILTDSAEFDNAREPLAQVFSANENPDYKILAITNHFKSKGGECGSLPEGCYNPDRTAQAEALVTFAEQVATDAGVEDILLIGDFNSYREEDPVLAIEAAGYLQSNESEPSYVYSGKVGSLDHIFANASADARITGADAWRINADESVLAEYSRYNYFASQHFQAGTVYRASDHNPIIVGIDVPDGEEVTPGTGGPGGGTDPGETTDPEETTGTTGEEPNDRSSTNVKPGLPKTGS